MLQCSAPGGPSARGVKISWGSGVKSLETPAFEVLRLVPMTGIMHWDSQYAGLTHATTLLYKGPAARNA
jgi:hypothetical protein